MDATKANADVLRGVMRRVPSPVTIVTALGKQEARGTTIGSFTSVSLEPPLISFNIEKDSQMHDVLDEASRFAVHILCDEHSHLCAHFAKPDRSGEEQLREIPHRTNAHGTPVLEDALTVIHCRAYDRFEAGDHSIIVGEVKEVSKREEGPPILYYDCTYRSIAQSPA